MAVVTPPGELLIDAPTPEVIEEPSLPGFALWVYSVMGVPREVLPIDSIYLQLAFDESVNIAYVGLKLIKNRSPWRLATARPGDLPPVVNPSPPLPTPPAVLPPPRRLVKSPSIYAIAVYNLAGHILCGIAADDPTLPPPLDTFWSDLRTKLGLNSFNYGLVTSASDQGTSAGQQIPSQIADMTMMGLGLLGTPWGRMYVMIAGQWGNIWGIS